MGNVDSKTDVLTLDDALKGGPGLAGYAYDADILCVECGREKLVQVYKQFPNGIYWPFACDSETIPQPIWFGESDYAQYCSSCAVYVYGGREQSDSRIVE